MVHNMLNALNLSINSCTKCSLHITRTNAVVGDGPVGSRILLLGEAPGASEDETGSPFQGASGRLLTDALSMAGLNRDQVRISNAVRCRPPSNRTPTLHELSSCREHLESEIDIVSPTIMVTLGSSAARSLGVLDIKNPLSDVRGRVVTSLVRDKEYRVLPTFHPAYALRSRRKVLPVLIEDLKLAALLSRDDG
jgi:DNA polymerase